MSRWLRDPLLVAGVLVGVFLVLAGAGTLITAPWQYYGNTAVTGLRIVGAIGTVLIGIGLVYLAWGHEWWQARQS